jgi:predicted MFS family arabinose efflux permease
MDANKPLTAGAAVALSCIGIFGIMAGPILASVFGAQLQLDPGQIGNIAFAEIGGAALASVLASFWIQKANWRWVGAGAIASVVICNLLSGLQSDPTALIVLRFLAGFLGQGTAFALAIGIIYTSSNPDRIFGFSIATQVGLGVIMLLVLPSLGQSLGVKGVLWPLAGLALIVLPMLAWIPQRAAKPQDSAEAQSSVKSGPAIVALIVLAIWCTGLGAVWIFLLQIGEAGGLSATSAGQAVAISSSIAIAGALTASALAGRGGRLLPVSIALLVQLVTILLLQGEMSFIRFTLTCAVFQTFWNFTGPYLMGMVAASDPTGRISVLIPVAQTGGFAMGPAIAGALMVGGSLTAANYVGVVGIAIALAVFVPTVLRLNRPQTAG